MKRWVLEIVAFLAFFALGWAVSSLVAVKCVRTPENGQIRRDTLVLRDTLRIEQPVERIRWVERRDTILVAVAKTDTLHTQDTIFATLPREVVQYADSSFRAQVSGVAPRLDWVEVFPTTTIVTERERLKAPRIGVGVQAGLGVQYGLIGKRWDAGPYIGLGVQYRF